MGSSNALTDAIRSVLDNNRPGDRRIPGCLTVACILASAPVSAQAQSQQTDDSAGNTEIEEIVVSASPIFYRATDASSTTKFDLPLQETPQAVSVLTSDFIESLGPVDLDYLSNYVPSAYNTERLGYGEPRGSTFIRGTQVSLFRGYRVNNYSFRYTAAFDSVGVERIEIPRGPVANAYGLGNFAGIINIITKKPQPEFAAQLGGSIGTHDFYRAEADVTGPVAGSDKFSFRIAAAYQEQGSIRKGEDFKFTAVVPSLTWQISDQTQLEFFGYYYDSSATMDGGLPILESSSDELLLPYSLPRELFTANKDIRDTSSEIKSSVLALNHDFDNDMSLQASLSHNDTVNDRYGVYFDAYSGPVDVETGAAQVYSGHALSPYKTTTLEMSLLDKFEAFGREHKLFFLGGYEERTYDSNLAGSCLGATNIFDPDFSQFTTLPPEFGEPACYTSEFASKEEIYNLGVQTQFFVTQDFSVVAGLRHDWVDFSSQLDTTFGSDGDSSDFGETTEWSYRLGLVYSVNDEINVYGNFSRGFLPQFDPLRGGGTIDNNYGLLKEIGAKGEFLEGRLGAALSIWRLDQENIPISDPDNSIGEPFVIPGIEDRRQGYEVEVAGQLTENLSLQANYSYVEGEITKSRDPSVEQGREFSFVPNHTASTFLSYTFDSGSVSGLTLGIGAAYNSSQKKDGYNPGRLGELELPSYTLVDIRVGYRPADTWEFAINVTNALDEEYFTPGGSDYAVFYGRSREVRATARVFF